MAQTIVVIDGMGGGIGVQLIEKLREAGINNEIVALGTNSAATERMMKAGANRGATGENAIKVSVRSADYILGPIGIVIPNSMLGEITPSMAEAILSADAKRIIVPLQQSHFFLAGCEYNPINKTIDLAVEAIKQFCH
ncbi:hypothetical protein AGMMS49942_13410 [Spirochaetia bacterium]|nr:hypothetical protein AGMMS49942_13410 [Spirochaetia bacterium]